MLYASLIRTNTGDTLFLSLLLPLLRSLLLSLLLYLLLPLLLSLLLSLLLPLLLLLLTCSIDDLSVVAKRLRRRRQARLLQAYLWGEGEDERKKEYKPIY